jgi:hypothetical protein
MTKIKLILGKYTYYLWKEKTRPTIAIWKKWRTKKKRKEDDEQLGCDLEKIVYEEDDEQPGFHEEDKEEHGFLSRINFIR